MHKTANRILSEAILTDYLVKMAAEEERSDDLQAAYDTLQKGRRNRGLIGSGVGAGITGGLGAYIGGKALQHLMSKNKGRLVGGLAGALSGLGYGGTIGLATRPKGALEKVRRRYTPEISSKASKIDRGVGKSTGLGALAGFGGGILAGGIAPLTTLPGALVGRGMGKAKAVDAIERHMQKKAALAILSGEY